MTRKLFFSFHYERDAWRAGQVRNCDMIDNEDEHGFIDAVDWEELKRKGDAAIKAWIRDQMVGTSTTIVLIGAETARRPWVNFEIRESWERGNAIVGLYIHNVKDHERNTDTRGANPLDSIYLDDGQPLSSVCKTYDWVLNDGRNNLGTWADEAFRARTQYTGETKLKAGTDNAAIPTRPAYTPTGPTIINNPSRPWAR